MSKDEEKVWLELREHRDSLNKLASKSRTLAFRKEDAQPAMRMGSLYQNAADACDLAMLCLELGTDNLTEVDRLRLRLKDWNF